MDKLIIRRLFENDLQSLVKLYKQFWGEESNLEKMKMKFKEIKDNPNYIFLCAIIDETIVGSITGIICEELYGKCKPFLIMEDLVVDKKDRNMGIGRALMIELEKISKKWDCTQILFITEANRKDAISFYESLGYNSKSHVGFKKKLK